MDRVFSELADAACAYADLAERHFSHEARRTSLLQAAATLARQGKTQEARQKKSQADLMAVEVFNYEDIHLRLIAAVKAYRKK